MPPRVRLAVLTVVVAGAAVVLALTDVVSEQALRDRVEPFGWAAPVAWVLLSTVLGAALLPGPVLAGASGLLFGAVTGTVTTLAASVLSALVSREVGFRAGREGTPWSLSHVGLEAVVVQRLAPGVPDAPLSYAFGALGVSRRDLALGTAVGSLPRAFSYTAIGASLDDPTSPLGWAGIAGVVLSALLGVAAGRRMWVSRSASRPAGPGGA